MDRIARAPEFGIAVFSFLLNFVWEFLQVPAYAGMAEMPHWEGIKICTLATLGDVGFSLTAFWVAALAVRSRWWFAGDNTACWVLYLAVGIALTIGFEYYYTTISLRWTYSEMMPRLPFLGTGLSPLVQWFVVPPLVIWFTSRQSRPDRPETSP